MPIQYFSRGPQGLPGIQGIQGIPGPPGPSQYGMTLDTSIVSDIIYFSPGRKLGHRSELFEIDTEFTKTVAGFTPGSGNGGMMSELVPDRAYAVYAIRREDDGRTDFCISDNFSSLTPPEGYNEYILIGAIRTDSDGHFAKIKQFGNYFRILSDVGFDYEAGDLHPDTWYQFQTIVPPYSLVDAKVRMEAEGDYLLNFRYLGSDETGKGDRASIAFSSGMNPRFLAQQVILSSGTEGVCEHYSEAEIRKIQISVCGWWMPTLGGF